MGATRRYWRFSVHMNGQKWAHAAIFTTLTMKRINHTTRSHAVSTKYIPRLRKGNSRMKGQIHNATVSRKRKHTPIWPDSHNVEALNKGGGGGVGGEGAG